MIWCTRGLDDIFRVTAGLTEHMVALRTPFEWETPRLRYRASPDATTLLLPHPGRVSKSKIITIRHLYEKATTNSIYLYLHFTLFRFWQQKHFKYPRNREKSFVREESFGPPERGENLLFAKDNNESNDVIIAFFSFTVLSFIWYLFDNPPLGGPIFFTELQSRTFFINYSTRGMFFSKFKQPQDVSSLRY